MSVFEFVFGLFSIVVSLALTHLLTGVAELIRNRSRVKFSAIHALWVLSAFALTVGNWAGLWPLRTLESWPAWSILLTILVVVSVYFICYFVTPDAKDEGPIDLVDFQMRERRSYLLSIIAL